MVAPLAYRTTRVTISGTYLGGVEEWSTGFWFGNASGDALLPTQTVADAVAAAWKTMFTNASMQISNRHTTTEVKLSSMGTDGKSDANDTIYSTNQLPCTGTATNYFPPQVALVASLYGPAARGLGQKGRMYIPGVSAPVGADGKIQGSFAQGISDTFAAFLTAVNAIPSTPNVVVLASHGQLDQFGKPKIDGFGPVTHQAVGVKVGSVYDTQRRRRNGIAEQYYAAAVNP